MTSKAGLSGALKELHSRLKQRRFCSNLPTGGSDFWDSISQGKSGVDFLMVELEFLVWGEKMVEVGHDPEHEAG